MQNSLGNIHTKLILTNQVVSKEKSFEKLLTTTDDHDAGGEVMEIAHLAFGQMS